jgi:transglutaminase-like putative cysteine protease
MRFLKIAILCIFLLSTSVLALEIVNPSLVDSMSVVVIQHGTLTVGKGVSEASLDVYIPQESKFQTREILEVSTTYNILTDDYGNDFLRLTWANPEEVIDIEIKTKVNTFRSGRNSVGEEKFFLGPTELVDSDNPDVLSQAEKLILNSKTDFDKIGELVKWTYEYVDYDLEYQYVNLSASETLKNRAGVCSEISVLFQALARSVGYETRTNIGLVISQYEEPYEFQAHSWSDVKIDNYYIPVDTTWAEAGYVDATHINLGSFPDSIFKEAFARVYANRNSGDPIIVLDSKVTILNFTESAFVESDSFILDNELWKGSAVIRTEMKTDDCVLLKINSVSCAMDSGSFFDTRNKKDVVYFCNDKNHFSIFDIPNDLKSDTFYTCPVTIYPNLGEQKTLSVNMKESFGFDNNVNLGISSYSVVPGEKIILESNGAKIFTSNGDFGSNRLELIAPKKNFTVYSYNNGNLVSQKISVINKKPFSINVVANDSMIKGDNYTVNITLENYLEEDQTIKIEIGNYSQSVVLEEETTIEVEVVAETNLIQVFAEDTDFSTSSSKFINLIENKNIFDSIIDFITNFLSGVLG